MLQWVINAMVYLGSALMVYNIYGFTRYRQDIIRSKGEWGSERVWLIVPIVMLVMFLLGYLAVGIFGKPDLIVSGILFGGSVFVFIIFCFIRRITAHIQETQQMEARLMAAEASSRAKTTFLSSVSHEMRTPMNLIIGLNSIALQDETLSPQTRDRLEKLGASASHLLDLINDVLDMNYMESGQIELKHEAFPLRETLAFVELMIRSQCDEKGLDYTHEVGEGVCEYCVGDAQRVRQVLLCILENAVKFTPAPGSVAFTAEAVDAPQGRCALRFTIRDTGIGMDQAFLPRLFDSFAQEDASTTNRYGGSGLHLAITKRLVDMMGGAISVTSQKGAGSCFVVDLTLDAAPAIAGEAAKIAKTGGAGLRGRRVLIVEDIDLNADILADILEMEDILSERAENGRIAVDLFSQNPPGHFAAILMDLRMPVMDGWDATRAIRALERPDAKTIPIIALTANASEEDMRKSLDSGMNAHLSKPTDTDLLFETLNKLSD